MKNIFLLKFWIVYLIFLVISCSKEESNSSNQVNQTDNNQEEQAISYTVNISSSEGGTVNTSSGNYNDGTVLNIEANAQEGYVFQGWEGFDSTNPAITVNVNQNYTLNAIFIVEEQVALDQNEFTDNLEVGSGTVMQGAITPNSTTTFEIQNEENLIAVVDHGFSLDLSVPDNTQGALVQFKNSEGVLADSYIQIERFPSNTEKSRRLENKYNKKFKKSSKTRKGSNTAFTIEIDFGDEITAGEICFNVHIYDDNDNISAGIEMCVTINNYGGGPAEMVGQWRYVSQMYTENGEMIEENIEDEFLGENILECYDYESATEENDYEYELLGYIPVPNDFEFDAYIVFHENGNYEDVYEYFAPSKPEIIGSVESCMEDFVEYCEEYDDCEELDILDWINDFYPTTRTEAYYGKWAYDEETGTVGIWDYSYLVTDSEGEIFDSEEEVFEEPYAYFENGTIVEIEGNTLRLIEENSWNDYRYITIFERVE